MNSYEKSARVLRAALAIKPLVMEASTTNGNFWTFRGRRFSPNVVKWLVDRGEAVRDGNTIRAV